MSVLIVWFALCFAFHRYEKWWVALPSILSYWIHPELTHLPFSRTRLCADGLRVEGLGRFDRESAEYKKRVKNVLGWFQPWTARLGMCGCLLVFIVASASWWDAPNSVVKVISAYGAVGLPRTFPSFPSTSLENCYLTRHRQHVLGFALWLVLKIHKGITTGVWTQWWVRMQVEANPRDLKNRLWYLEFLSEKNESRNPAVDEPQAVDAPVAPEGPPPEGPLYVNSHGSGHGNGPGSGHGSGYGSGFVTHDNHHGAIQLMERDPLNM